MIGQDKGFREKVREVMAKYCANGSHHQGCEICDAQSDRIVSLVRELVPLVKIHNAECVAVKHGPHPADMVNAIPCDCEAGGWNACIKTMTEKFDDK